jgi:hypothetical protein
LSGVAEDLGFLKKLKYFFYKIINVHQSTNNNFEKMSVTNQPETASRRRYKRPKDYASTYLQDGQHLQWYHKPTNMWVIATYNKDRNTFKGINSKGEYAMSSKNLNQVARKLMLRYIGRATCDGWIEFKTMNGERIDRLDRP